jgi:tRNA threonylcarbamoyladenosine biosynthesis protein TsaE
MTTLVCKTIDTLPGIALQLLPEIIAQKNICFFAPMGAGKTTTIKAICIALGVDEDEIHSPTYSIVNEYKGKEHIIFHFDFFRLKSLVEAYDFGLEEYFVKDAICLMEWAEIVEPLIPLPYLKIMIEQENEERIFTTEIINF